MKASDILIGGTAPGMMATVALRRFGAPGRRPKVYIQAGLHADEVPPMLVAHHLLGLLRTAEETGQVRGEIVVAPAANPLGLSQAVLHGAVGRFDVSDGRNFNRGFPWLGPAVAEAVGARLGPDAAANRDVVRQALREALESTAPPRAADRLKQLLLGLALDADLVLDLHCGSEAVPHLYTLTPLAETFAPLAGLMGARALLLATESGDDPFDEACSRPWLHLQNCFPQHPIPLGCASATLEFRGEKDVSHGLARADARAVLAALVLAGAVDGTTPSVPPAPAATDLAAAEPLVSPVGGLVVFHAEPGATLRPGAAVADIIDPITGKVAHVTTATGGMLFTRTSARFVLAGARLGTIAGSGPVRPGGSLLSA